MSKEMKKTIKADAEIAACQKLQDLQMGLV
jgi:hypothetical protein